MKILVTPTSFKPDHPTPALEALQRFSSEIVDNPPGQAAGGKRTDPAAPGL